VKTRRQARVLALQALFEIDSAGHGHTAVIDQRLAEEDLAPEAEAFFRELVGGVLEHLPELNSLIATLAPDWPISQMAIVDRNILRLAIYEMLVHKRSPVKVVINEAVELAKLFGSDSSRRFVNGVLGTLVSTPSLVLTDGA
jgi:N utilization substance protein B